MPSGQRDFLHLIRFGAGLTVQSRPVGGDKVGFDKGIRTCRVFLIYINCQACSMVHLYKAGTGLQAVFGHGRTWQADFFGGDGVQQVFRGGKGEGRAGCEQGVAEVLPGYMVERNQTTGRRPVNADAE